MITKGLKMEIEPYKILKALAHPDRLSICRLLNESQELSISEIRERIEKPQAVISQQVTDLFNANILVKRKAGTAVYCSLNENLKPIIIGVINQFNN